MSGGMRLPTTVTVVTDTLLSEVDRRVPGLTALALHGSLCWGEFYPGSDLDFVGVWDEVPGDLALLREAHEATLGTHPDVVLDGFHLPAGALAEPPRPGWPVFFGGRFDPRGEIDQTWVTWHELAERAVVVRGELPPVLTDAAALRVFTAANLDTYWRGRLAAAVSAGPVEVGGDDDTVVWVTLGVARLHHLLATGRLTSKSGAGRYVLDACDERWHRLAADALRLRERAAGTSSYDDPEERGRDLIDFLAWAIADGLR